MRLIILLLIAILTFEGCNRKTDEVSEVVVYNSLGYTPKAQKRATIIGPSKSFEIINLSTSKSVYNDKCTPSFQQDVNQEGSIIDFSELTVQGKYFIRTAQGIESEPFEIKGDVYNHAFYTSMRAFYLWRCGTAVKGEYNGLTYSQEKCHESDGYLDLTEFGAVQKDGAGGWHDAGDYGKYITNAGITLGTLFMAWDNFEDKLSNYKLDIPTTTRGYPDFLQELKWETDWFLKMQYPDSSGRVFHKLTRKNFSDFIMPHEDDEKRYFAEWGTTAIATFSASMAMASRYYKVYDEEYARVCLEAAQRSYQFLIQHPEYKKWDQKEFTTGGYQTHDLDSRIWAAAELWETTGDEKYLKDFESKIEESKTLCDYNWDWGNMKNLGVFTYLLSERHQDKTELFLRIKSEAINIADSIVEHTNKDLYGRPFNRYYWGCNGTLARLSANLYTAYQLSDNIKYKSAAYSIGAHLLGRNYYQRSFVTGIGVAPPLNPHDRRCGADTVKEPWPGYLVGGGHSATDWVDEESSYSHNEIAINWQAALVYNLAWLNHD